MFTRVFIFISLMGAATLLPAQAVPTASRAGDVKIGGGFSSADSDYYNRFNGGAAYFN